MKKKNKERRTKKRQAKLEQKKTKNNFAAHFYREFRHFLGIFLSYARKKGFPIPLQSMYKFISF